MRRQRVTFTGGMGETLAARLDSPDGPVRAQALFAHCFTCGKDVFAATKIAAALADEGVATLRFDFTGLGHSDGEFANTTFSSNVDDLVAAADHLRAIGAAPTILIGHSLGGAAAIAAAHRIPEVRAVAVIGAPAEPKHVTHNFHADLSRIESAGEAEVSLAGRPFRIRKSFLDDLDAQRQEERIAGLRRALLVLHAPTDATVGIENATKIFVAAKYPKAFIGLDGADHLLTNKADAAFVGTMIAQWAARYIPMAEERVVPEATPGVVAVAENGEGKFGNTVAMGRHRLRADEPAAVGGLDAGPSPYDLLTAALGTCTAMTMRMVADHKGIPLDRAEVRLTHAKIHAEDCADCEGSSAAKIDAFTREITLHGALDAAQRAKLLEIADKCPVHRTLHGTVTVRTVLND